MGKGDNTRPSSVSRSQYESNWDRIFKPKKIRKAKKAKPAVAKKVKKAKKARQR